ncbi:hypothetical protein ACFSTH_08080 [Paenibacillus yanchengensis]|uniref:Lipoprotein n=1 Tax=Paenibacillus yanchengensis TaxID=2035833 RepID=A0ABW4YL02_9BACL
MKYKILIALILLSVITGCTAISNTSELSQVKEEQIVLTTESKPEDLQNGPNVLHAKAQQFFYKKDLDGIKDTLTVLTDKYPTSVEQINAIEKLITTLSEKLEQEKEQEKKEAAKKQAAEEKRLEEKIEKMRTNYDLVKDITWYHDKTTTEGVDRSSFALYFGEQTTGYPWLRIRLQYSGYEWVFVDSYIIKVDDTTFNINPSNGKIKRDNKDGKVWEYYDALVTNEIYNIITAIIDSETTIIRHQGDQYYFDWFVIEAEKKALRNVLDAYEALGGKEPE